MPEKEVLTKLSLPAVLWLHLETLGNDAVGALRDVTTCHSMILAVTESGQVLTSRLGRMRSATRASSRERQKLTDSLSKAFI